MSSFPLIKKKLTKENVKESQMVLSVSFFLLLRNDLITAEQMGSLYER